MTRIQDIEDKLKQINEAIFQELCDCLLSLRNDNYKTISRIGSQEGKQKTIKGTPDTFLVLPNGKYIFVEYSTNNSKGLSKIKEDIEKCLDIKKTNIPLEKIDEIIYCINYNLDKNEIDELYNLLSGTEIKLDLYTLDKLALELNLQYRNLVHDYLTLTLDTGQIVSIDAFVFEYNNASNGIATPLNNPFFHRENELKDLKSLMFENNIIILQGEPGVGKTKLAIEIMNNFLKENLEYNAFCISNKFESLLNDLRQYLDNNKNNILFVDDANRIDTFCQILGFYKEHRKGKLKIIITVRDYALDSLLSICQDFLPKIYKVNKLTDEQIIDIIKEEPFKILGFQYHNEILRISEGNPRLAIMAALLFKDKKIIELSDTSDLFERYFSTFIRDNGELKDPNKIKILGIIAFFYAIPYINKELTSNILNNFELDYNTFINDINQLDKLEIVNILYEYVKIPEQNMAIFFFYKAFIKDNLLSFSTLIEKYFENNKKRLENCIIQTNNTFGYHNVIEKIRPILIDYLNTINNNEDKVINFLSVFWAYLQDETLEFIYKKILLIPENNVSFYEIKDNENKNIYNKNEILALLEGLYQSINNLKTALELSFEYIRKLPAYYSELIDNIKKSLIFDIYDGNYGFKRQFILFELLINGLNKKDILFTSAFCELSKTFLHFKYHHTKGGRHNTINLINYPLPNISKTRDFRRNIWDNINNNFSNDMFKILQSYLQNRSDITKELMQYDIPYLINIIMKNLTPDSFEHCKYVQEQIYWCKKIEIDHPEFSSLRSKFRNHLYEMYLVIDWNRYRDKEDYDFDDYHEYEKLKENEIRRKYTFNNTEEIRTFYKDFLYLCNIEMENRSSRYNNSLDIILDENLLNNFNLGCLFLIEVIDNNLNNYFPDMIFRKHLVSKEKAEYIWNLLQKNEFKYKPTWELMFLENIPIQLATEQHITFIKNSINNINYYCNIFYDKLEKFQIFDQNLFGSILNIIVSKNEVDGKIHLWYDTFDKYFEQLGDDIELIKKAYLQQVSLENIFDYDKKSFLKILTKDKYFLLEFVKYLYKKNSDKYYIEDEHELIIIWQVGNIETVLNDVFDLICEEENYYILKEYCNSFFYNVKENTKERAKIFLFNYCKKNYKNSDKVNLIINIIRHTMREYYEDIILLYLSLTQDKELFSKISWRESLDKTYSYDVNFGDLEASDWRNIYSIVDKSDLGIKLLPIKQYINSNIEIALKSADFERRRKYLENW